MTASVRFVTFSALRMAVTWFFTVGSARSRLRQIALLLFPLRQMLREGMYWSAFVLDVGKFPTYAGRVTYEESIPAASTAPRSSIQ
jgi:hypothetical protein